MFMFGNILMAAAIVGAVGNNVKSPDSKQKEVKQQAVKNKQDLKKGAIPDKIIVQNKNNKV